MDTVHYHRQEVALLGNSFYMYPCLRSITQDVVFYTLLDLLNNASAITFVYFMLASLPLSSADAYLLNSVSHGLLPLNCFATDLLIGLSTFRSLTTEHLLANMVHHEWTPFEVPMNQVTELMTAILT